MHVNTKGEVPNLTRRWVGIRAQVYGDRSDVAPEIGDLLSPRAKG